MNSNRRVLQFVAGSISLYLLASFIGTLMGFQWMPFLKVNLISDVVTTDSLNRNIDIASKADSNQVVIIDLPEKKFDLYKKSRYITGFQTDTSLSSLNHFMQKLYELKSGQKPKVRIAYFGDSMIEGDLLTQTLRKLLQQTFGGSGVGFVPVTSQVSKFRQTVSHNYSGGWQDENFKTGKTNKLYFSGHLFRSSDDWVQMTDNTITVSTAVIEKSLLCGNAPGTSLITVNGRQQSIKAPLQINRIPLLTDGGRTIRLTVNNSALPVYGISFESPHGVILDNFSFRGITGVEFARIDSLFMEAIDSENPYDLIIFQYGVNLLYRPNEHNFSWYGKAMLPIVKKFRNCFDKTDFLIVSTADRAFRYGGEYKSATGIDSLVKIQAMIAYETGSAFYNQFASMGGANSIVNWAKQNPSLANKDYVHPNHRGAEVLGTYLYEAIINDFNKYIRNRK